MLAAVLASGPTNLNFIPTDGGFLDLLFHQTKLTFEIFGWPRPPFSINLIQLIIVLFLAFAINGATERLTGRKVSLTLAVIITVIGSYIFATYVKFPFDFSLEGVRIVAAVLGALIIAVFYTLIVGRGTSRH
jgi:hypothetical protein